MLSLDEIKKGLIHHKLMTKSMIELNHDECFDCPYRTEGMSYCKTPDALFDDMLELIKEKEKEKK